MFLSDINYKNLAAYVFNSPRCCLSQQSSANLQNSSGY